MAATVVLSTPQCALAHVLLFFFSALLNIPMLEIIETTSGNYRDVWSVLIWRELLRGLLYFSVVSVATCSVSRGPISPQIYGKYSGRFCVSISFPCLISPIPLPPLSLIKYAPNSHASSTSPHSWVHWVINLLFIPLRRRKLLSPQPKKSSSLTEAEHCGVQAFSQGLKDWLSSHKLPTSLSQHI